MLHRNAVQAAEDGPENLRSAGFRCPPTELRADLKHDLRRLCDPLRAGRMPRKAREVTMTVSIILAHKGRESLTIEPTQRLADAIRLLAEKRIGAAIILGADRRIAGIISERDIVRTFAERGAAVLDEPVSGTMTRKVETCNESETCRQHHGAHDRRQVSPPAGDRSGSARRHRLDRRHRQAPRCMRWSATRSRCATTS